MTKEIQDALLKNYYLAGHPYGCKNFSGCNYKEADVLTVNKSRYVYEFEVKISRGDFFKDLKKVHKHKMLSGEYGQSVICKIPNRFYYVCPDGLIKLHEVPPYAGLIYFKDGLFIEIKAAKLIHKIKGTDQLIFKMCDMLSARNALGCCLMTYKNRESKKLFEKLYPNNQ